MGTNLLTAGYELYQTSDAKMKKYEIAIDFGGVKWELKGKSTHRRLIPVLIFFRFLNFIIMNDVWSVDDRWQVNHTSWSNKTSQDYKATEQIINQKQSQKIIYK